MFESYRGSYDKQRRTKRFSVNTAGKRYFYARILQGKRCQNASECGPSQRRITVLSVHHLQGCTDVCLILCVDILTGGQAFELIYLVLCVVTEFPFLFLLGRKADDAFLDGLAYGLVWSVRLHNSCSIFLMEWRNSSIRCSIRFRPA